MTAKKESKSSATQNLTSEATYISPFEAIRQSDTQEDEYWSARDLARVLGYNRWETFPNVILKAETACTRSGYSITDHFRHMTKLIQAGKGAKRSVEDVQLSRYACYLVIQNSDPTKPIVALGQTYFAVQTRRIEELDEQAELAGLSEDQKRLFLRSNLSIQNNKLAEAASQAGVVRDMDFAVFQDWGYRGLYGGLDAHNIHRRKGLDEKDQILDHMGSDELIANLFRASQTRQRLERDQTQDKDTANRTHFEVGAKVRQTIEEIGGTRPEDLPTPVESIQQVEAKERKRLKQGPQLSLFDESDSSN